MTDHTSSNSDLERPRSLGQEVDKFVAWLANRENARSYGRTCNMEVERRRLSQVSLFKALPSRSPTYVFLIICPGLIRLQVAGKRRCSFSTVVMEENIPYWPECIFESSIQV